jgi:putative membrane protein
MIRNFADHSANERTFLAWVRTAIAVMAFGFIVEKFDLFLEVAAPSLGGRPLSLPGHRFGNIAGLALIALGIAMVAVAAARFLIMAKTSTAKSSTPVWARASISHSPPCSSCSAALYLFISRTPWSQGCDAGHTATCASPHRSLC